MRLGEIKLSNTPWQPVCCSRFLQQRCSKTPYFS